MLPLIFQVNRIDSTFARIWCQRHIPYLIRESILHSVGKEIDNISTAKIVNDVKVNTYRFVKFWSILYNSQQMHTLSLPSELDSKARTTLISYLGSGFNLTEDFLPTLGEAKIK